MIIKKTSFCILNIKKIITEKEDNLKGKIIIENKLIKTEYEKIEIKYEFKCTKEIIIYFQNKNNNKEEDIFEITRNILTSTIKDIKKIKSKTTNNYILLNISHIKCYISSFIYEDTIIYKPEYKENSILMNNKAKIEKYNKEILTDLEIKYNELVLKYKMNLIKNRNKLKQKELFIKELLNEERIKILGILINKGIISELDIFLINSL